MQRGILVAAPPVAVPRLPAWFHPVLLAGPGLALTALLPTGPRTLAALAAIILLGVPHGALDGEIARSLLRPRFGRSWFGVFAVPYLLLAALVLLAWHLAPVPTLAAFLLASVWHFGSEETGSAAPFDIIAAGGLPIALAVLTHPTATAAIFATVSQTTMIRPPLWLWSASLFWIAPATLRTIRLLRAHQDRQLIMPAVLVLVFVALPPLTAFAIYFVCVHAPAHIAAVIAHRTRAPRVRTGADAVRLALPVTGLTLLLGACLWPVYSGPVETRLLCLTIQGLAALTLPHMLFERWLDRRAAIA